MKTIYYGLCGVVFVMGLLRGTSRPSTRSAQSIIATVLFWVCVLGIAGFLASVAAIIGIAAMFDERTDSTNGFDTLFAIGRRVVGTSCVLALVGHGITVLRRGTGCDAGPRR